MTQNDASRKQHSGITMQWIIGHSIEWESKAQLLYTALSEMFADIKDVSSFWGQMSSDELTHMEFLEEIRERLPKEALVDLSYGDLSESILQVEKLFERDLLADVETLYDAYVLSNEIENSELNAIFRLLAASCVPQEQRKAFMLAQVNEHMDRLLRFGEIFPLDLRRQIRARKGQR